MKVPSIGWATAFLILFAFGALGAYFMSSTPDDHPSSPPSAVVEPKSIPQPSLTLSLPPSEIARDVAKSGPMIPKEDLVEGSQKEGEAPASASLPVGVALQENNEPVVQLHLKKKSNAAVMADLQDQLDGLPVGAAPED